MGYFLSESFGKVMYIHKDRVDVQWLFTESYTSKLRPWYLNDGSVFTGVIQQVNDMFVGGGCSPLKAQLDRNKKLKVVSLQAIKNGVGENEFNKFS